MPENKDVTYSAAAFLRDYMGKLGKNLASSHAHELTAAYMGFNSKKALIDSDQYDLSDPELVLSVSPDISKLEQQVRKLRPDLLQKLPVKGLAQVIKSGLTPPCECCGYHLSVVVPITDPSHRHVDGWVCMHCVDRESSYKTCRYCGDDIIYRAHNVNSDDECPEHAGESILNPEEEQGYWDLIENWQNR